MKKKTNLKIRKPGLYVLVAAVALLITGTLSYVLNVPKSTDEQSEQTASKTDSSTNDAYASIPTGDIQFIGSEVDVVWDLNDPYYFYNEVPVVALVHIDSIDGGRNYSPIFEQYVSPQTIGKMTVLEVYKGDVKSGQNLKYSRLGGIVTAEDYMKGLSKAESDKINHLNNGKKAEGYIKTKVFDDIDIAVDKEYVVFLRPQSSKDGKVKEYFMEGMQYGLREAKGYVDGSDAKMSVLNNETGTWESPGSLLKNKAK